LFYRNKLNASEIQRIGYTTRQDKLLQQNDIDLILTIGGRKMSVSEKDRDKDYNDVLIEFYSMYPESKGWMDHSQAQCLAYFFPARVFLINKAQLVEFYKRELQHIQAEKYFDQLIKTRKDRITDRISILDKPEKVTFIAARNRHYTTMSIAISLELLQRASVRFRIFDLD
jgi:hypothetical protein